MNKHDDVCRRSQLLFFCSATLFALAHGQQSLLQAWTKSQKIHSMTEQPLPQTKQEQADSASLAQSDRSLKFHMPLIEKKCGNTACPINRIVLGSGPLTALSDWLWVREAEHYDCYVHHRLSCGNSLVSTSEEADLCYPTCTPGHASWMPHNCFEVPLSKRNTWANCSSLCLGPKSLGKCSVEAQYLHGIIWPQQSQDNDAIVTPWGFNFERTALLAFVGGEHRGSALKQDAVLLAMRREASRINASSPETVFSAHIVQDPQDKQRVNDLSAYGSTQEFYSDTWGFYASASFSWQPSGDASTRRGLYDSLMFGCVPVIDTRAAHNYRHLFKGILWKDVSLDSVFVVIPEGKESDGQAILQLLISMPAAEVDRRRSSLRQIASALQWGAQTRNGGDALLMALRSFRSGPLDEQH